MNLDNMFRRVMIYTSCNIKPTGNIILPVHSMCNLAHISCIPSCVRLWHYVMTDISWLFHLVPLIADHTSTQGTFCAAKWKILAPEISVNHMRKSWEGGLGCLALQWCQTSNAPSAPHSRTFLPICLSARMFTGLHCRIIVEYLAGVLCPIINTLDPSQVLH